MATRKNVDIALSAMFPGAWENTPSVSRKFWTDRMARALDAVGAEDVSLTARAIPWDDPNFHAAAMTAWAGIREPVTFDDFKEFVDASHVPGDPWDVTLDKARGWARLCANVMV